CVTVTPVARRATTFGANTSPVTWKAVLGGSQTSAPGTVNPAGITPLSVSARPLIVIDRPTPVRSPPRRECHDSGDTTATRDTVRDAGRTSPTAAGTPIVAKNPSSTMAAATR